MNNNTNTTALNIASMGIEDFDKAIKQGTMTTSDVIKVLDDRIAKRNAAGKRLIPRVVEFRNALADSLDAVAGTSTPKVELPQYTNKAAIAAIPSDPDKLADLVFSAVGATGIGAVISRLTARIAGV